MPGRAWDKELRELRLARMALAVEREASERIGAADAGEKVESLEETAAGNSLLLAACWINTEVRLVSNLLDRRRGDWPAGQSVLLLAALACFSSVLVACRVIRACTGEVDEK